MSTPLTGPVGRAVAVVGVVFLVFSLFMGKISWGLALSLGLGLAALLAAQRWRSRQ